MKIAFVFYEYPPDTADGGIATYLRQVARMLCARGHQVEVFAGARGREGTFDDGDGITVHRIACPEGRARFHRPVAAAFQQRHARVGFDVVEGAEYLADSRDIPAHCPEIPLVVRLHTGTYLLNRLNRPHVSSMFKLRVLRGALPQWMRRSYWRYDKARDVERLHALDADHIASPCSAMSNVMISVWDLDPQRVTLVPPPFLPSEALLNVPVDTCTNTVTFLGRLEVRKGVLDLARAIPRILRRHPQVRFRFVGRTHHYSPQPGLDMRQYLERELAGYGEAVEFAGAVALDEVPNVLATTYARFRACGRHLATAVPRRWQRRAASSGVTPAVWRTCSRRTLMAKKSAWRFHQTTLKILPKRFPICWSSADGGSSSAGGHVFGSSRSTA
jgi:glycogen(starch) synthase